MLFLGGLLSERQVSLCFVTLFILAFSQEIAFRGPYYAFLGLELSLSLGFYCPLSNIETVEVFALCSLLGDVQLGLEVRDVHFWAQPFEGFFIVALCSRSYSILCPLGCP